MVLIVYYHFLCVTVASCIIPYSKLKLNVWHIKKKYCWNRFTGLSVYINLMLMFFLESVQEQLGKAEGKGL